MKSTKKFSFSKLTSSKYFSFGITVILFAVLYIAGMANYKGFAKPQVFYNLFIDNATLIILTVGVSFVLLVGGIDISIGSVVALTCMVVAKLLQATSIPAVVVMIIALAMGAFFGFVQGYLITRFRMQPFIVTLAGQFFAKGLTAVISRDTIEITDPLFVNISSARVPMIGGFISIGSVIAIIVLIIGTFVLKRTAFGRSLYALGGNEQSAGLMGLPTERVKISAYTISGFCAALGGIVYCFIMLSGYPLHAVGMHMDAISSSVIGGTLLTGGVVFLPGTLFGVLIQGVIQTFITFQGTLSAWWTRIVLAALLCLFIVMQTLITNHNAKKAN